jgi:hypothetical protein
MHFNRLLGAALAALFFLGVQNAQAANDGPLTGKRGTITTQNLVAAGACTAGGCVEIDVLSAGALTVQVTGTYTASGGLSAQATTDGVNWVTLCSSTCSTTFTRATTGATSAAIASGVQDVFQVPVAGYRRVRITALGAVTGTATIAIQPTEKVPSGFASITGGAGDASAANQVTGNASLASIDGKMVAGAGAVGASTQRVVAATDSPEVATLGAVADAAATQGSTGSVSAKLRTVTSQLNTTNTSLGTIDAGIPAALGAAAMAAAMPVTIATDDARIGIVTESAPASDTASSGLNGRLQRIAQNLTTLNTSVNASNAQLPTALGATTASASLSVTPASDATFTPTAQGRSAAVTLTRTADTNAYAANDVIGAATGSTAALTFTSMCSPSGSNTMLTTVTLEIDASAVISGETSYRLYLYNVTPPSALGDNAAHDLGSGDRASFLGYVDLGTPVDLGSTLYVQTTGVNKQVKCSGTSLFGYLVTVGAYTPTSARVHVITLNGVTM